MSKRLSKEGNRMVNKFKMNLECNSSEECGDAVEEYRTAVQNNHSAPSIRFIMFEDFEACGGFPRSPDNKSITRELDEIDRNNSFLVFISHCWLRGSDTAEGWDGSPHPDNAAGDKYRLCCDGIKRLKSVYAPRVKDCYVWMDYCCMNQDSKNNLSKELEHYDRIVEVCDCLVTPIVNYDRNFWDITPGIDVFSGYKVKKWNQGRDAYLNRAWCRVEMLYAAMIPVLENDNSGDGNKRHTMFEAGLAYHCSQNRRPHFLFDFVRLSYFAPYCLPPLQHSYLNEYHPLKGHLTIESDMYYIRQLLSDLQPYIDSCTIKVGYSGETNKNGQPHGRGVKVYDCGKIYEGEWKNGLRHGYGVDTSSNGYRYEGLWDNDKRNGKGFYYFSGGSWYEGEFLNDLRHGQGKLVHPDGSEYNGEWKDDKKCGHGVYTFASGAVYDGEFFNDLRHGCGRIRCADGSEYNGQWKNDAINEYSNVQASGSVFGRDFVDSVKRGHGVH